ncbi:MAG: FAD-binding protein [Chloroflexaceae bacterium]|nr:FAD-binding protein [Chloroflexaceae bacterium]
MPKPTLITELNAALGPRYVLHRPEELMLYEYDGSALDQATPEVVVVPSSTAEVAAVARIAQAHGLPLVARGAGTGLAGGSIADRGGIVVSLARMDRILSINPQERTAVVQPGVVNVELSERAAPFGLHFAPDPSSQKSSTVGGNAAANAGGPHCLKYGVTTNHVLAATLVLSDGSVVQLGGSAPDAPGYDLLGAVVGSEGTLGIVTELTVRLTANPEDVRTFLAIYDTMDGASSSVAAIIAAGIIPAALEMLVGRGITAVEESVRAGYPAGAAAVLLIELDGLHEELQVQQEQVVALCREHGASEVRVAADPVQRAKLWAGRKGALAACARIAPHYHIQDGVVPRSKLIEVLRQTEEIAARYHLIVVNIFHAGDGNLHPLLLFDMREPGVRARAIAAGEELLRACVAAGGTISGEHGIGLEKRDYIGWMFNADDLSAFADLRAVFDGAGLMNPCKLVPSGSSCADIRMAKGAQRALAAGAWV